MRTLISLIALCLSCAAFADDDKVVNAVLFVKTNCPDCKKCKNQILPAIKREYGKNLRIRQINIETPRGEALFEAAIDWVPLDENKLYVPLIVIDHDYLVGSKQISARLTELVDAKLATGSEEPAIPGLKSSKAKSSSSYR